MSTAEKIMEKEGAVWLVDMLDRGIMKDALEDIVMLGSDDPTKETEIARTALETIEMNTKDQSRAELALVGLRFVEAVHLADRERIGGATEQDVMHTVAHHLSIYREAKWKAGL